MSEAVNNSKAKASSEAAMDKINKALRMTQNLEVKVSVQ
jgi:hypothetical protein